MGERFENHEQAVEQAKEFDESLQRNFRRTDAHLPVAHGEAHDVTVTDDSGRAFTMRTEDGSTDKLTAAREIDQGHTAHGVRLRMFDGDKQAGYANLTLEVDKAFNNETGHFDRVADCRLKVNDIYVQPEYRGHGIGRRMLERAEDVAHQGGAREIYGNIEREEARGFFERNDHQIRPSAFGGEEHYRTYYYK